MLLLVAVASVPLAGGELHRVIDVRIRWMPAVLAAFVVQILVVNVLHSGSDALHSGVQMATYVVLAACLARNLRLPGLPLIALGGLLNALAIFANHGVMPATAAALRTAGLAPDPGAYTNSALVHDANLWFLGDVFGVPSWVPAANVFSVGDLLLVAGAAVLMHKASGSRLFVRRPAAVA